MLARQLPRSLRPQIIRLLHVSTKRAEREKFDPKAVERAQDEVDVCIVGAGPAGLSAAIRLKQLEQEKGKEIRVVVLEKGPDVGKYSSLNSNDIARTPALISCTRCSYPVWSCN